MAPMFCVYTNHGLSAQKTMEATSERMWIGYQGGNIEVSCERWKSIPCTLEIKLAASGKCRPIKTAKRRNTMTMKAISTIADNSLNCGVKEVSFS